MTAAETATVPDAPRGDITEDELFEVISNERRREVIRILDAEQYCELRDVSTQIAALENDCPENALTGKQRKRVYVTLYQCHLPKLNRLGVVVYDQDRGTIQRGEAFRTAARVLAAAEGATEESDEGLVDRLRGVFA